MIHEGIQTKRSKHETDPIIYGEAPAGLELEGIHTGVTETKNADGFFIAWAFVDGVRVGMATARSRRRARAYALGQYVQDQIAESIKEDGW